MNNLFDIANRIATTHGLNPAVVRAVCSIESNWNPFAVRFEPAWSYVTDAPKWAMLTHTTRATEETLQKCSWGLMQVMGTVARELGYQDELPKLCQVELGITYGCKKLASCLKKHKLLPIALAAYNAGNPEFQAGKEYAKKVILLI